MSWLDDYAARLASGLKTGVADVLRHGIADIGNAYQQVLMADATIKPPRMTDIDISHAAERADIERSIEMQAPDPTIDIDR
jgi:hypothetical protein